jgi:hypothetical protein
MLGLAGLASAEPDLEPKILAGVTVIGFAIVCADAGRGADELADQGLCYWGHRNLLAES